ncbi:helix-turn-helix domain-containing protein [Methylobacterium sp. NMS12]|uniref:helix-turn-helix domain-containing protein n=1 Tax=Methylobacterium sp. NMS12 TaxID=3079766 RepID=UPI003F881E4E
MAGDAFTRDLISWQNQVVADRELTPLAFHVAYVIGQHLNRESGDAWPSQVRLAEILEVHERSVRNAVEQLRSRGHLSVIVRHGRGDSNRYRIILKNRNEDSSFGLENRNAGSGIKPEKRNAASGFQRRNRNGASKETGTSGPPNHLKEPSERGYIPPTPQHARSMSGGRRTRDATERSPPRRLSIGS